MIAVLLGGLAGCSLPSPPPALAPAAQCRHTQFDLPISAKMIGTTPQIVVQVHSPQSDQTGGAVEVMLDTGSPTQIFLVNQAADQTEKLKRLQSDRRLRIEEFNRTFPVFVFPISANISHLLATSDSSGVIMPPQLINESGYTVLDLRHRRLMGFATANDMRACVGPALRVAIHETEKENNRIALDAAVDGEQSGRMMLDSGSYLTQLFDQRFADAAAIPSPPDAIIMANGKSIIPTISTGHRITIGNVTKPLPRVAVPTEHASPAQEELERDARLHEDRFIGILGRADFDDSILIFPPKDVGYWEFIF